LNYFAHGLRFVDDPYYLAGTAVPDWLNVVDRKVRARSKAAKPWIQSNDKIASVIASGIVQHHHDDDWFHRTDEFNRLQWKFTAEIRDFLGQDSGMRPSFLGHILVELLLDSTLIEEDPHQLSSYYQALGEIDAEQTQRVVEQIAGKPADKMAWFIERFLEVRFLADYPHDEKLLYRLNQVMQRVKLPALPETFCELFSGMRVQVRQSKDALLAPDLF